MKPNGFVGPWYLLLIGLVIGLSWPANSYAFNPQSETVEEQTRRNIVDFFGREFDRFVAGGLSITLSDAWPTRQEARSFPELPESEKRNVDQVLETLEQQSKKSKRKKVEFEYWTYSRDCCRWRDPESNQLAAYMLGRGSLKFESKNRIELRIDEMWEFRGSKVDDKDKRERPNYRMRTTPDGKPCQDRLVVSDKELLEFQFHSKKMYRIRIPDRFQPDAGKYGPLAFVADIDAEYLKETYWIRIQRDDDKKQIQIEAFPRKPGIESSSFKKYEIAYKIEANSLIPISLKLYGPNFDENQNPEHTVYRFTKYATDGDLEQLKPFISIEPANDSWKVIERKSKVIERKSWSKH